MDIRRLHYPWFAGVGVLLSLAFSDPKRLLSLGPAIAALMASAGFLLAKYLSRLDHALIPLSTDRDQNDEPEVAQRGGYLDANQAA